MTGWVLSCLGTGGLMAASIALGTRVWMQEMPDTAPLRAAIQDDMTNEASATPATSRARAASEYALITERPLFAVTRRPIIDIKAEEPLPVADQVEVDPPQEVPEPRVQLMGVITGGAKGSAYLEIDGNVARWFLEGETIEGWLLSHVSKNSVELRAGERRIKVNLYNQ